MNARRLLSTVTTMAALASSLATAQIMMEKAVVAGGGGRTSSAATSMDYTVGQPVVERATGPTMAGQFGFWNAALVPASVNQGTGAGAITALSVTPNPVLGEASISVALARTANVVVAVYDVLGKLEATLFSGDHPAGTFSVPLETSAMAPGTYFVAVSIEGSLVQRPMTIMH